MKFTKPTQQEIINEFNKEAEYVPKARPGGRANIQTFDWGKILDDIAWLLGDAPDPENSYVRVAISYQSLANWIDVPRKTMIGWLEGTQPKHADGEALIAHWMRLSGKGREFAPKSYGVLPSDKVR